MKRIVLTASVLSAMILTAGAQTTTSTTSGASMAEKASVGVHAGANLYTISGKTFNGSDLGNDLTPGFSAGVNVAIPLGSSFYVQPGLDFVTKGAKGNNLNQTVKLNYLELPVTFLYKPALGAGRLNLGFGPYFGYGVGGKLTTSNGSKQDIEYRDEFDTNTPEAVQFRKSDAGANFLAGYEFANKLSLNLKAQLGLKDIAPDRPQSSAGQTKFKNTGFGLSLGYRF